MPQLWANLSNVSRILRVDDYDGAIFANVSKGPHVGGAGHQVLNFEGCVGLFCRA